LELKKSMQDEEFRATAAFSVGIKYISSGYGMHKVPRWPKMGNLGTGTFQGFTANN
jgi:hypothetical protein